MGVEMVFWILIRTELVIVLLYQFNCNFLARNTYTRAYNLKVRLPPVHDQNTQIRLSLSLPSMEDENPPHVESDAEPTYYAQFEKFHHP